MKYCSTCGQAHMNHEQYCSVDGTVLDQHLRPIRFEQASQFCVGCGHEQDGHSSYCPTCGHSRLVAATSEGTLLDRLPSVDDMRKKWRKQDWGAHAPWKEKGQNFLSRFDTTLTNPNLVIGCVTALVFFAALAVTLFILLGIVSDETALIQLKEAQQQIGSDFSSVGLFFFFVFISLAGLQVTSSEDLKSWFTAEATRDDVSFLAEIQRALNEVDFHLSSGHLLLSLPGLVLLLGSAWLLDRGGIVGGKATSWNERIERALAFTVTLTVITLLAGIVATDFGIFNLHLLGGLVRSFVLILSLTLMYLFMSRADLKGRWEVGRLSIGMLISTYLACLILTSLGQITYLQKAGGLADNPQQTIGLMLINSASPLYIATQGGQVDMKMTVLTEEYRLGLALYGEDRISDLEGPITEAENASNLDRIQEIVGNQIQNGEDPTLNPKIERFDETVDMGLISHLAKLADTPYKFQQDQLLKKSVLPYGLIILAIVFIGHIWIGLGQVRSLSSVVLYAGVFAIGGLILAYFTQTRLEVTWDDDALAGITVSALTFWNALALFLFPFVGALTGYGIHRLKNSNQ